MTTYFVSRHQGAKDWAKQQGITVDKLMEHIDPEDIRPGDIVIGTLPIHLAAQVQKNGGRYIHLTLNLPADMRGSELSAADMTRIGAKLTEYLVEEKNEHF